MKYFFEDEERKKALYEELQSWLYTPFSHRTGVKGLGCDCIHLVLRTYESDRVKALKPGRVRVPVYPKDWHIHSSEELLLNALKSSLFLEEVDFTDPMDGDILLHYFDLTNSHTALYCNGFVYHAIAGCGVQRTSFKDPFWNSKIKHAFRMLA